MNPRAVRVPTISPPGRGLALRYGVGRPALALSLYLPGALIALLASLPLRRDLERYSQSGPWVGRLGSGNWPAALLEPLGLLAASVAFDDLPPTAMVQLILTVVASLSTVGLGLLVHGLLYNWLAGGLLATLSGDQGRFWTNCPHWFWPMVRLSLLDLTIFTAVTVFGMVLLAALLVTTPGTLPIAAAALALLLLVLNGILEIARAALVSRDDRRAVGALLQAFRLFVSPSALRAALLVWLLLALLGLSLVAAAVALHLANPPALLTIIAGQTLAFAAAWLKITRLAVAVELSHAISATSASPPARHPA